MQTWVYVEIIAIIMFMGSSRLNIQTGHYAHINTVMESGMRLKHRLCYTYIYIF